MKAPHSSILVLTTSCVPIPSFATLPTWYSRLTVCVTQVKISIFRGWGWNFLPLCTFYRLVLWAPPVIRVLVPRRSLTQFWIGQPYSHLPFLKSWQSPLIQFRMTCGKNPTPEFSKYWVSVQSSKTSVALGQATSSGFSGSSRLPSCFLRQKPLSPFLASRWNTPNGKD